MNKREIVKPFALCYSSKNRIERYLEDKFRTNITTDIVVEKVSVKISIKQIASFLLMIKNTSKILTEKYSKRIKRDEEIALAKRNPLSSLTKKSVLENDIEYEFEELPVIDETTKFKETLDIFSNRYYKVPNIKKQEHLEVEDEEEEKLALNSKAKNLEKLKNPIKLNKSNIAGEEIKVIEKEEEKIGTDSFTFFFHGLSIYFINDYKDNFYPVLCFDFNDTNYAKENRSDGSFVSQSQLDAQFSYYNINNGYWEPFIEGLNIAFEYDKQGESKVIQIKGKESINLNLSPDFVAVVNN